MDKMLEEAIKAGIMVIIAGILYWVGQGLAAIAQTRTNNKDVNREILIVKQAIQERDRILVRMDKTLERIDDRLADLDKRLTIVELFLPKQNRTLLSKFKGSESVKDL